MRELYRDYFSLLGARRRRALVLVGLLTFSGLLEVAALTTLIPMLSPASVVRSRHALVRSFVDEFSLDRRGVVAVALCAFVVLGLASAVTKFGVEVALLRLRVRVEQSMRDEMTRAVTAMDWSAFHTMRLGDLTKALITEGYNASLGLQLLLLSTGAALISLVFLATALVISARLTAVTVLFALVAATVYRRLSRRVDRYSSRLSDVTSSIGDDSEATFGSLKYVRSTGTASAVIARARVRHRQYAMMFLQTNATLAGTRLFFEGAGIVFVGGVLSWSFVTTGALSAASLSFLAIFYRLAPRLHNAQEQMMQSRSHRSYLLTWRQRQEIVLSHPDRPSGSQPPTHEQSIALNDVVFRYPGATAPAVKGVDLTIHRGECVAIVGESGSGKTTVLDLVSGLLAPQSGTVTLDGVPLEQIDREAWQAHIGLVMQDSPLYHASVLENIAWSDESPDLEHARQCTDAAGATTFIEALPDGFDTVLGERGGRLSGGQRQRIALARALYRRPWLLMLDEATSALDADSEALVLQALTGLKGTCTMLIVTHRPAPVAVADRVLRLEHGRPVEPVSLAGERADGAVEQA